MYLAVPLLVEITVVEYTYIESTYSGFDIKLDASGKVASLVISNFMPYIFGVSNAREKCVVLSVCTSGWNGKTYVEKLTGCRRKTCVPISICVTKLSWCIQNDGQIGPFCPRRFLLQFSPRSGESS